VEGRKQSLQTINWMIIMTK